MKAISIRQPWASLIVEGYKDIENRTWESFYRGPLLIHASLKYDYEGEEWIKMYMGFAFEFVKSFPTGCLMGQVTMDDCVIEHPSDWFFGPFGFVFKEPMKFLQPISYKGKLGIFNVPYGFVKTRLAEILRESKQE